MPDVAIEVEGLTKSYGDVHAVRGIDLQVAAGEVFALLGPNGAGKTTTVEILEGYRARSGGRVSVLGHDPELGELSFRQRIGIVLQETGVERFLTVAEVIDQFRSYYPHPRPRDEVIEVVGLTEKRDERVGRLSVGQQRRLDVAVGLAGDPDLLFLDEPTTSFDPNARRGAWEMIRNLQSLGKTVFLTTHYMDEAEALADRVAVIAGGLIVAEGTVESLASRQQMQYRVSFALHDGIELPAELTARGRVADGRWRAEVAEPTHLLADLTGWAVAAGVELEGLHVAPPTLEDVYLALTGQPSGQPAADEPPARGRRQRRART